MSIIIKPNRLKEEFARPRIEQQLDFADKYGTSSRIRDHGWEGDETFIYEQKGLVKRSDTGKLTTELADMKPGWEDRVAALLIPFEEED